MSSKKTTLDYPAIDTEMYGISKKRPRPLRWQRQSRGLPAKLWTLQPGKSSPTADSAPITSTSLIGWGTESDWTGTSGLTWSEVTRRRFNQVCASATNPESTFMASLAYASKTVCTSRRMEPSSLRHRALPSINRLRETSSFKSAAVFASLCGCRDRLLEKGGRLGPP